MSKLYLKHLRQLYSHMSYYNRMAPFPPYDTEYVKDIENKIKEIKMNKEDYDELPVEACKYCDHLDIRKDDLDNAHCIKCNSINDLREFKNIQEYLNYIDVKRKQG